MERRVLATFVASVEPQHLSDQSDFVWRKRERRWAVLSTGVLTLFTLAVSGYHPYAEDGGLYLAGVKRLLDPALYPFGTAFVLEPTRRSLFAPIVAAITRMSHLGLPLVLLLLHAASVWVTLFAAWMLAARCWRAPAARAGAVVLLACWLTLPVAGTALLFMDPYLTARSFSTPCMVLALAGALETTALDPSSGKKRPGLMMWACSLSMAAAMHPLMAAYALAATLMLMCARSSRRGVRRWGTAGLAASAMLLAACLQRVAPPESPDYVGVAMTRTYWFPAAWSWYELVGLAAPLAILAMAASTRAKLLASGLPTSIREASVDRQPKIALARMAAAVGATAALVALCFTGTGSATHLVARMQPLRAFQIVYLVMILVLGATLGEFVLRRSLWRWAAAVALLGGVMLIPERAAFPNSNHAELPWVAPRNLWVQAFLWIRDNTPKNAVFALDADYINSPGEDAQCFRAAAERSALADYSKDGGEAAIAPELTAAWKLGQIAQQRLSDRETTDAERMARLTPLGVSWVVLRSSAATNLVCPYANAAVRVCRLP
jgi:hypothetical protein